MTHNESPREMMKRMERLMNLNAGFIIGVSNDAMRLIRTLEAKLEKARSALVNAVDSLEYVQNAMPLSIGHGVRAERIAKCDLALAATKLDTWNEPEQDGDNHE